MAEKTPKTSPLHRIENLQEVDPKKVADLEARLKRTYVSRMSDYVREARLRAEAVRDKILD